MIYQMSWLKNNLLNPLEAEMWRVRSRPSPPSVSYRASSPLVYSSSYRRGGGERTCASRLMAFFCFLLVAVSCYLLSRACITFANNDANAQVASEQWDHITDDFTAQFENHSLLVAFTAFLLAGAPCAPVASPCCLPWLLLASADRHRHLAVCCACCTSWCGCQYFKRRRSDEKEAKSAVRAHARRWLVCHAVAVRICSQSYHGGSRGCGVWLAVQLAGCVWCRLNGRVRVRLLECVCQRGHRPRVPRPSIRKLPQLGAGRLHGCNLPGSALRTLRSVLLGAFPVYCIRAYAVAVGVLPCASG